ncbi:MAG: alpha/beta hydrolase [Hyphomicrobiales bacterium]|nr:MAG: alpha/beta hydrolase [Hyphomicrobiales bacterium]
MEELYPGTTSGSVTTPCGVTVGYHDAGGTSEQPPVILLHGSGGRTATHFFTLFPMIASRHRVIGIDLVAYPQPGAALTLTDLVEQVVAVIDERASGLPVTLAGYSMGSCVAAAVAATHPEKVAAMALLNGWAKTDNALRLRLALWKKLHDAGDIETLAAFQLLNIYGRAYLDSIPYIGPRPYTQLEQMCIDYEVGPGSDAHMRLNATMDISALVGHIRARTLVIGSQNDQLVPLEHSHELFGAIEGACLAEIPGGHASVTERPAHLFHLIDRFLREPKAFAPGSTVGDDVVLQLNRF